MPFFVGSEEKNGNREVPKCLILKVCVKIYGFLWITLVPGKGKSLIVKSITYIHSGPLLVWSRVMDRLVRHASIWIDSVSRLRRSMWSGSIICRGCAQWFEREPL